jgi:RNA polymerase sigma-70 factor (ECF subfamily)
MRAAAPRVPLPVYVSIVEEQAPAGRVAAPTWDRARFEEEVLALADDAFRVARRLTGNVPEAEDLVQEAYVRALRSWEQFQPGTNLRAWLLRIVHNLFIDQSRKKARTPIMEPVDEGDYYLYHRIGGVATPDETDAVLDRLSQGHINDALASLSEPYRDTVVLVDLLDFSYQEAADILGVPIGTVMSRLHRGRRMLKSRLAEALDDGAQGVRERSNA